MWKEWTKELQNVLEEAVANNEVAGGSLLVLQNGEEIAYAEAGYANREENKPYKRDTICRLYSMTKPVTAAAAMILVERGRLDLAKPVADYLPAFRNLVVREEKGVRPPYKTMLVRNLLSMTSGLSYGGEDPAGIATWRVWEEVDAKLHTKEALTTAEIADKLADAGLTFDPGEAWMYGTSADVLGAVIEKVSGMRFGEFLEKEIFAPLGMTDTGFYVPQEKQHRLARVYESVPGGMAHYPTEHLGISYALDKAPAFESGGAGLVSTLDDYAKFATMLMQGGNYEGVTILKPKTVEFLTTAKLTPWQQESMWKSWEGMYGYTYGNLMRIMVEPGMGHFQTWKGEYGWDGWLGAYFCNSPSNGVTILMSFQKRDGGTMDVTRKLRNVLAANLEE